MSKIIENLGSDVDKLQYKMSAPTTSGSTTIMSIMYFVCVKFTNKTNGRNEEINMILKRPPQTEFATKELFVESQFYNEILFYRMYAKPNENFPKYYYLREKPLAESVIAMENVINQGYYPCSYKYDAPLEYTLAAVREMGRFHGKGYVMKELEREKFFDIVKELQDSRYDSNKVNMKMMINTNATRAVEYLRCHGYDTVFCDKMEVLLSNAYDEILVKTLKPSEPLSTICHGDFTMSNTLFKTEANGQYRAMLIDFALIRYGTPVIDLSTYLCISCPKETRKDMFFNIMQVYHEALKEYLLENNIQDIEKYSYDALLNDYKRGGLCGFFIASFFLPILLGHGLMEDIAEMQTKGIEVFSKQLKELGGDTVSKILADMLLHLVNIGCVEHIL